MMLDDLKFWFQTRFIKRPKEPPLARMQLRSEQSRGEENPLMVCLFLDLVGLE